MHPQRKKRLILIVLVVLGVGIAVGLALSALQQNINLFYTPSQIAGGEAPMDARIRAGIAADPDTHEVSDAEFALMRRPGRPLGSGTKTQITLRIDTVIVDKYKATGPGWQTRINEVLRANARY